MKFLKYILAAAALMVTVAQAAPPNLGNTPIINSASTTKTNQTVGTGTNWVWPVRIDAATSVTNVTAIDVTSGSSLALEFDVQTTAGGSAATNIIVQLGRSVSGGSPTNAVGTGLKVEWVGSITNTLPASFTNNQTYTACSQLGGLTGFSTGVSEGAMNTIYVGWITTPTGVAITNYSIYAKTK